MSTFLARFLVLQTVGLGAVLAFGMAGWLGHLAADRTGLTYGIAAAFVMGLGAVLRKSWRWANWIARALVMLGLIGTVLGFIIALSGVDPERARDLDAVTPMIATLIDGMGMALYTTLVGSAGNLWLRFTVVVLGGDRNA